MEFALQSEGTYQDVLAAARLAEDLGLAAFATADHYLYESPTAGVVGLPDSFALLAGLARETSRIELATLVSPITFRHPAVLAKLAATIDQMSGGRFSLGVGTGWMEVEHQALGIPFPPLGERFERLEEALIYLRAAFGKAEGGFEGRHYRLGSSGLQPQPAGPMRLIVGGNGPRRTPRLAGAYADEYNQLTEVPAVLAERIGRARAAAERAGRDPTSLRISVAGPVVVGRDERVYGDRLAEAAAARGRRPEELEERLRRRGVPLGTAAAARRVLDDMAEAGVDRFYLQGFASGDPAETLNLLTSTT
ncbi:MAG: LLM class flavin-dependent oxidoreductase [Acidimicrobiia bacterium]